MKDKAAERFHATARQAATIATQAGARRLLIGHFSSRYETLFPFLEEACAVFEPTDLALEGVTYLIRH
jgi:ribonuclease Z